MTYVLALLVFMGVMAAMAVGVIFLARYTDGQHGRRGG